MPNAVTKFFQGLDKIVSLTPKLFPEEAEKEYAAKVEEHEKNLSPLMRYIRESGADIILPQVGMFRGVKGAMTTAEHYAMEDAIKLLKVGANPELVRRQTGWFKGPYDEMLRKELNASEMKLKPGFVEDLKGTREGMVAGYKMEDVVDFPELFEAYPELKNIEFGGELKETVGSTKLGGRHVPESVYGPEEISTDIGVSPSGTIQKEALLNTLAHEIQHSIQDVEGFARGGSPKEFPLLGLDFTEEISGREYGISAMKRRLSTETDPKMATQLKRNIETFQKEIDVFQKQTKTSGVEAYRSLAGEVESRFASARRKLTPEERLASSPVESMLSTVPKEGAIVKFRAGVAKDIPEFPGVTNTKAAVEQGLKASPEQLSQAKMLRENFLEGAKLANAAGNFDKGMELATNAQLMREMLEAESIVKQFPDLFK